MHRSLLTVGTLALAAAVLAAPAPPQAPFTLEQVLSAPFPSLLVRSPRGDKIAWAFNDRGARNVWVAEAPGWSGRALTRFPDDDGLDISDLTFTPDGSAVLFTRG